VDGLPLIASASGGTPELVVDGETGLLFEPGNASDLAVKLTELATK
jgi:glycosyltransferase involved in cell wall biosynthesis